MTELLVGGVRVILPKGLNFSLNEENPEITNNGEFTWDVEVSLLNAINVKIFKHIDRKNVVEIGATMDATLIIDNRSRNGKIIILKNSDVSVTFQFVSGNSEFNYNAKADSRKIWELDWGTETAIDYARALDSITNPSYLKKFVCTPVMSGTTIINDYSLTPSEVPCRINGISNIVMQPYLLYYINKLPELLGFTLKSNILNDDNRAKRMFVVNSISSLNYSDALPDMTVSQFINEIEFFFNVTFFIDKKNKEISVQSLKSNFSTKSKINIDKVFDSYDRDLSQESKLTKFGFTKISYNVPDSLFFKYQFLSDEILSKCEIISFGTYSQMYNYLLVNNNEDQFKIYKVENEEYIFGKNLTLNIFTRQIGNPGEAKHISLVNKLRPVGETTQNELVLKLCPAEIIVEKKEADLIEGQGGDIHTNPQYQLPKSSLSKFDDYEQGITHAIENDLKQIPRTSNIEVSLFTGKIVMENYPLKGDTGMELYYPFSHIDKYPEYGPVGYTTDPPYNTWVPPNYGDFEEWMFTYFIPATEETNLRIDGVNSTSNGIFSDYHFQQILDTSKEYTFTVPEHRDVNANNIFCINNKDYMPISLDHKVTIKGFDKKVTGKFYALK